MKLVKEGIITSKYSAVTSLLVVISDSTATATFLTCPMASSSLSAGTRTATFPLKSSALSDETVHPPMLAARDATLSIDTCMSETTSPMWTVCERRCAAAGRAWPGRPRRSLRFPPRWRCRPEKVTLQRPVPGRLQQQPLVREPGHKLPPGPGPEQERAGAGAAAGAGAGAGAAASPAKYPSSSPPHATNRSVVRSVPMISIVSKMCDFTLFSSHSFFSVVHFVTRTGDALRVFGRH